MKLKKVLTIYLVYLTYLGKLGSFEEGVRDSVQFA